MTLLHRLALPFPMVLILGQCAPSEVDSDTCGAAGYENLVGSSIAAVSLPAGPKLRVIGPDDLVTADFMEDRVNIAYDAAGRIFQVTCG